MSAFIHFGKEVRGEDDVETSEQVTKYLYAYPLT
jgi:hypothetical protein